MILSVFQLDFDNVCPTHLRGMRAQETHATDNISINFSNYNKNVSCIKNCEL